MTRNFHAVTAEFNALYNGGEALIDGNEELATTYRDNFWEVLPVERFEIRQSMMDDALDTHPDTGKPIRRVITGGYLSTGGGTNRASPAGGAC